MPVTQLAVFFLGALALVSVGGLMLNLDDWTRVVLAFFGAILWGTMGLSAFDVYAQAWTGGRPMPVIAYLGIGAAMLTALLGLHYAAQAIGDSAGARSGTGLIDR
jgi:uncharacterized membrane protein YuzA (DUF378 family)